MYVNLQGIKWNLEVYLICIKRQGKKINLGLCIFHYSGSTLPIYAQCFASAVNLGSCLKCKSGSDSLFQKKMFTAKDKQTLSVQPQCEKGQGEGRTAIAACQVPVLDFETHLSSGYPRFPAWHGGIHLSHPRAAMPCRFSVSPCSQKVGAVLEIWGYTLNSCFYSIHKQNPDNCGTKNNCGKEGERP